MKRILFIIFLVSTIAAQSQELKLWYKQPAVKWTEALPIGNGRLGAMIFGGVEKDRIQFNEETLWTGEPRDYNRKGAYKYLPQLRQLLFEGKQKEAEALAEKEFMGLKSSEGKREQWIADMKSLKGITGNPASPTFDDSKWKGMEVPSYEGWEAVGFDGLDGAVWLRTSFDLPASWQGKELVLDLNRIRDVDYTYVNGKLIGSMEGNDPRRYAIPKEALVVGKNIIAVQVLNFFDKGGITGYKDTSRHIGVYPKGDEASKLSLNGAWKYYIQNNQPPVVPQYQAAYQPFGDLWLNFKTTNVYNYRRELDLSEALCRTIYTDNGVNYTREYFVSQPHQVIAIHVSASQKGKVSFEAALSSPHLNYSISKIDGNTVSLSVQVRNGALKGMGYLQVTATNGNVQLSDGKLIVNNADDATIYVTANTNYKNYHDVSANPEALVKATMRRFQNQTYADVKAAHLKEYQSYFNTFSIEFGNNHHWVSKAAPPVRFEGSLPTDERVRRFATSHDASFVALYTQYGRYLLISSSRPGTRPANLQGIWNDLQTPPWGSKYTTNINAEMNYWPAQNLNLSTLHEPLLTMIEELSQSGKTTAKEYYNAPGWVVHHNTDLWRGTAPINASNHGIWVTGGAWLSHHLWEHYLFTQDKSFLRSKGYPIMKEAARFFQHYLVKDAKTGWLISGPSNSPEQGGLVMGPSMDHQIIRSLYKAVIHASEVLKTDKIFRDSLQKQLAQIAPDQIGKYGQLQEWLTDKDDTTNKHRHVSHLWGVHPGKEINWEENPEFMKAARQSLLYRGDAATGWSLGWKINFWARFKDGDHAYKLVQMLLSPAEKGGAGSYPNLFDAHPPFQIDGNFGGAAGVGEMLVQSHTKYIDILPALPTELNSGTVKGICARGAFVIDMSWNAGALQNLQVLSKAGNTCLLRYNGKTIEIKTTKGKTYKLNGALELIK